MWRSLVKRLDQTAQFTAPASAFQISQAETALNIRFPDELKECLGESNGILGQYGLNLIWSVKTIITTNLDFRTDKEFKQLYMPFEALLFFADAGNGDLFAFPIQAGQIRRPDIFVWNHEDDSRAWVAPDLERYLRWWLEGKITV